MFKDIKYHIKSGLRIVRECGLSYKKLLLIAIPYYFATLFLALLDGIGMLLFVGGLISGFTLVSQKNIPDILYNFLNFIIVDDSTIQLLYLMLIIFALILILRMGAFIFEGLCSSYSRMKLQKAIYNRHIYGDWEGLREFKVGESVGTITQEVRGISKYVVAMVQSIFYFIFAFVM